MLYVVLLTMVGVIVITVVLLQIDYRRHEEKMRVRILEHENKKLKHVLMQIGSGKSGNPELDAQDALDYNKD